MKTRIVIDELADGYRATAQVRRFWLWRKSFETQTCKTLPDVLAGLASIHGSVARAKGQRASRQARRALARDLARGIG